MGSTSNWVKKSPPILSPVVYTVVVSRDLQDSKLSFDEVTVVAQDRKGWRSLFCVGVYVGLAHGSSSRIQ